MSQVAILGFARTPVGALSGALRELNPDRLGTAALTGAVQRAGVPAASLARVLVGSVLGAGRGPNPARALVLEAGFEESPGEGPSSATIRAGGGSGLEALVLAGLELEGARTAAAIGLDVASQAPYYLPEARGGSRLGAGRLIDGALKDAWAHSDEELPLPALAAVAAQKLGLDRKLFLEGRAVSVARARAAAGRGELVPVGVPASGGETELAADDLAGARDPSPGDEAYAAALGDGAACVVLGLAGSSPGKPLAFLRAVARVNVESRHAWQAPCAALTALLAKAKRAARDLAVLEIDESLFVAPESSRREHGLDPARLNPRGGAHAYGHLAGACGLRALVALLAELEARGGLGAIAYGTGGGGGIALLLEKA